MREGELQLALRDPAAATPAAVPAWRHGATGHHPGSTRGKIRLQHQAAAEGFHHDHGLDRATTEAAMRLGEWQAEQAEFGILLPDPPWLQPRGSVRGNFLRCSN